MTPVTAPVFPTFVPMGEEATTIADALVGHRNATTLISKSVIRDGGHDSRRGGAAVGLQISLQGAAYCTHD